MAVQRLDKVHVSAAFAHCHHASQDLIFVEDDTCLRAPLGERKRSFTCCHRILIFNEGTAGAISIATETPNAPITRGRYHAVTVRVCIMSTQLSLSLTLTRWDSVRV